MKSNTSRTGRRSRRAAGAAGPMAPDPMTDLRRRAEEKQAAAVTGQQETLTPERAAALIHDLHVHQIELEMQNDELRRTREALEASQSRYFDIFEQAPVGYLILGEKGAILEANLTAAALLGSPKSALRSKPLFQFILPEDQDVYYHYRRLLLAAADTPPGCELRIVRPDGATVWVHLTATVDRDAAGRAAVQRVAMSDITLGKKAEQELQRLNLELEERVEMRTAALQAELLESATLALSLRQNGETLRVYQEQLQALSALLAATEERERRELAAVLHDDILQLLAVSRLCLETPPDSEDGGAVRDAASARRLIAQAIARARNLTHDLSPQTLYEIGVAEGIKEFCEGFQQRHGLECAVESSGNLATIPPAARGFIFGAVREFLQNVARHACARRALVSISLEGEFVRVRVEDDGRGIDRRKKLFMPCETGGFGLFSVRERAKHMGGAMRIDSPAAGGCAVELRLPFHSGL